MANLAVFLAGILLLHLSLRALGLDRPIALALPVVYALLPNYSTDRFWFATFNANLSLTLFCAALYAEIRAVRSQAMRRWRGLSFTAFLVYGLGLPHVFWRALVHHWSPAVTLTGLVIGAIVFVNLYYQAPPVPTSARQVRGAAMMAAGGVGLLILGYAPFMLNYNLGFTPTGVGNRTAIAGALGVAVSLTGIVAAVSAVSGSARTRRLVFATTIAALCVMGTTVTSTIASFWTKAYATERAILQGLHGSLPAVPDGGTVILDGICSHVGPAVVFLMDWDVTGALRVLYQARDVRGDVVLPYTQVTETGITIHRTYPYRQLYVYNHAHRVVLELTSVAAAPRYFERFNPDYTNGCPPFGGESGVPVF